MPKLNWTESSQQPIRDTHSQFETQVRVPITTEQQREFIASLRETFASPHSELRLELPAQWTLYWKARDGESRLLLAHPEKEVWVGTVALSPEHAAQVVEALETMSTEKPTIRLSELGSVSRLGNLEVEFSLALS